MLLVTALFVFMIVRLPWHGDMGVHAATIERLRHDLVSPGNPMVDAPTESPYYSPWMVLLALFAKATDLGTFDVLRCAAALGLVVLFSGVWHFTRTLSGHRAAPPLAVLCLLFLWGREILVWSGFLGLTSLSFNVSYPSTLATGLGFHFLALLHKALIRKPTNWAVYPALGTLWAVVMLSHQFSGVVFTFGALGLLASLPSWPERAVWLRFGAGLAVGLAVLAVWPYYSFFGLFGTGGLEDIHKDLYGRSFLRFTLVPIGVLALAVRLRRFRRDPLVVWFLLGVLAVGAGAVLGKWSLGRAEPAIVIPAQIAAALCAVEGGKRLFRAAFGTLLAAALAVGAWGQKGALGLVVREDAMPSAVARDTVRIKVPYEWITPYTEYGDVLMTTEWTAQKVPGYGVYTVVAGYPDFFLPDEEQRRIDTARYFARETPREERLAILRKYHVEWVLQWRDEGGLSGKDPALRFVKKGPNAQMLYRVVG
ncbi:hypothetical protein RGF97_24380 [Streptomyces roseicoloratus]|uniref:Glycosyltransferase RgtA/B/C/D-like domain-containing protein n=1 Tax=Streptomyces roseicoloratus TaxID=2508722 RepID=A0ABY9RYR9_9ACTN|nr:hypothetical protein [Streptomyces roseicoloratus]WMX47335.1 hypothetical protein RGF97_24380 [Streptomyces roseicoloratus]